MKLREFRYRNKWRFAAKEECTSAWHYAHRKAVLRRLGFDSYAAYLKSDLWAGIRERCLQRSPTCELCGKPATQVHHRRYRETELVGRSIRHLFSVCAGCHIRIEFNEAGEKRNFTETRGMVKLRPAEPETAAPA